MKFLIVGRSGSGKDKLRQMLEEFGLTSVISSTTRPRRTPDEDNHVFLTQDEADELLPTAVATTVINGYTYFATASDVIENDIYIVDPKGVADVTNNMPDVEFDLIYVFADTKARAQMAISRAADPESEVEVFQAREASEMLQFADFEETLQKALGETERPFAPNVFAIDVVVNDYQEQTLANEARQFVERITTHRNYEKMLNYLAAEDIMPTEDGMFVIDEDGERRLLSRDHVASAAMADDESARAIIDYYLAHVEI